MHSLLYPVQNEREALRRQGLKPKDHAKENVRHIRELQQLQQHNAQTELKRQQTETELFKMQKFKDAKSQVREWIEREGYLHPQGVGSTGEGAMQRPATTGGYIRKGEGQRRGPASRDSILEVRGLTDIEKREKLKIKPAVPTRLDCRATDQARPSQDYLTLNALAAIRPSSAQPKSAAARVLNPVNTIDRYSTHTNTVAIKHEVLQRDTTCLYACARCPVMLSALMHAGLADMQIYMFARTCVQTYTRNTVKFLTTC